MVSEKPKAAKAASAKPKAAKAAPIKSNPHALQCRFFLADDLRQEIGGKVFAIGLYSDDVIVMNIPAEAPAPTVENPIGFEGVCIMASMSGLVGTRECKFELLGPDGETLLRSTPSSIEFQSAANAVNLISRFRPLVFSQFGHFKFVAQVGEHRFEYVFEVRRGVA